jgi:hypothetical protein
MAQFCKLAALEAAAVTPIVGVHLMPTSNEYRQKAEQCFRMANEAHTEADRLACLDLARTWLEASLRQDEMTPPQIAEVEELELTGKPKPGTPQSESRRGWRQRLFGFFR